jgi:hypothetical protein
MGRPLKIAKSQAVITITATAAATDIVTTSANFTNLGIIAGMPFVTASNVGGLIAGTLYWILQVVNAGSNSTFTVSATPLNANPNSTKVDLSSTSGQTIATTDAPVDMYFNNPLGPQWPATNANTYSVVGGNTAQYGKQVLCNVALGQTGTGTLYGSDGSNVVGGLGTDLANIAAASVIQYIAANGTPVTLGYVDTATGVTTVAVANTQNTGNIIGTSGNAQTLYANLPVAFSANLGGLVAGTTYFVKAIANASAFTVSTTVAGPEVDLSNATGTPDATQDTTLLTANATANIAGASFIYATPEAGYIVRQKGKQKYLVQGSTSGLVGQAFTANVANTAMLPNTMTITATYANSSTVKVQSLSDHTGELFTATSGPVATGNIVFPNAAPAFATFNNAAAADAGNAQPYPLVQIGNA